MAAADEIGYPVVMKIVGPKILHKTDVGGVKLDLRDGPAVRSRLRSHGRRPSAARLGKDVEIWGVLIQKMMDRGKEVILGVTRDKRFGPVLMVGLGGIYTEILKDVCLPAGPHSRERSGRDDPRNPQHQAAAGRPRRTALRSGRRGGMPACG